MTTAKRTGRKKKPADEKVISIGVYLTIAEKKRIEKKYKNITTAVRQAVLPLCG